MEHMKCNNLLGQNCPNISLREINPIVITRTINKPLDIFEILRSVIKWYHEIATVQHL